MEVKRKFLFLVFLLIILSFILIIIIFLMPNIKAGCTGEESLGWISCKWGYFRIYNWNTNVSCQDPEHGEHHCLAYRKIGDYRCNETPWCEKYNTICDEGYWAEGYQTHLVYELTNCTKAPIGVGKIEEKCWETASLGEELVMEVNNKDIGVEKISFTLETYLTGTEKKCIKLKQVTNATVMGIVSYEEPDNIYKYFIIEPEGITYYHTNNIKIKFSVVKSFFDTHKEDTVVLNRYTEDWSILETNKLEEKEGYIFFEANARWDGITPEINDFVITAEASFSGCEEEWLVHPRCEPATDPSKIYRDKQFTDCHVETVVYQQCPSGQRCYTITTGAITTGAECKTYCPDFTNQTDCESEECYWRNDFCYADQCLDYSAQSECESNSCYWYNESCHEEQQTKFDMKIIWYILAGLVFLALIFAFIKLLKPIKKSLAKIKFGKGRIGKGKQKKGKKSRKEETVQLAPAIDKSISTAVKVEDLKMIFRKNVILDDVNFEVKRGEMCALLAPSGTGKSLIVEAIAGRKIPSHGKIELFEKDIKKDKNIYNFIGFVPQHPEIYMNQTVMQNLLSSAIKWNVKNAQSKAQAILSKIGLLNRKNLKAKKLSGGQQRLLSLGMELIRDVELCLLDEPTTGLDPNTRNNIITILSRISTQMHKTVLFTTHFMDDAEECDKVIILSGENIAVEGPPSRLKRSLPGGGRIVEIILDNITDNLLKKIKKIKNVKKIIKEGRKLKIIMEEPNAIRLGQQIEEYGGVVNQAKIGEATMMEVFVYYTGEEPKK